MKERLFRMALAVFAGLVIIVGAIFSTGCATVVGPSGSRRVFFLQRGIILQVTHTCTDVARVYQVGPGLLTEIVGAEPRQLALGPAMLGDREIQVTVQSVNKAGNIAGTYTERFYIDEYSTTARSWTISDGGWSSGDQHSQCQR